MIMVVLTAVCCLTLGCGPSGRDLSDGQWLDLHSEVQRERNDMQAERAEFARQRDLLEADRRQWDNRQRSEPVIAAAISSVALIACCSLPLILMIILIWPRPTEPADQVVSELLIDDMVHRADRPHREFKRVEPPDDAPRLKGPPKD